MSTQKYLEAPTTGYKKSYSPGQFMEAKTAPHSMQQHFTFTNPSAIGKTVSTPVASPGGSQYGSRSQQAGLKMVSETQQRQRSSNGSKVRSFSQNQNNRKVIANFLNSNSMQLSQSGFGRGDSKEKYSSLINKSVTSVGWQ